MIIHKGNQSAPMGYHNSIPIWDGKKFTPVISNHFYIQNIDTAPATITLTKGNTNPQYVPEITVEYSKDGINWSTWGTTSTDAALSMVLQSAEKVYFRANEEHWGDNVILWNECRTYFGGGSHIKVGGNIMSLVYGGNFTGEEVTFPTSSGRLAGLFANWSALENAEELVLPATTLPEMVYGQMFRSTNITKGPFLPASHIVHDAYRAMFMSCANLIEMRVDALTVADTWALNSWLPNNSGIFYKNANTSINWSSYVGGNWTITNL